MWRRIKVEDSAKLYAQVFSTEQGKKVLEDLRAITLNSALPAASTDGEIRHMEGQRFLTKYIENKVKEGKK